MSNSQYIADPKLDTAEHKQAIMIEHKSLMMVTDKNDPGFIKDMQSIATPMNQFVPSHIYVVDFGEPETGVAYSNFTNSIYIPRTIYELPADERKAMLAAGFFARVEQIQQGKATGDQSVDQCRADKRAMEIVSPETFLHALDTINNQKKSENLHLEACENYHKGRIEMAKRCVKSGFMDWATSPGDWFDCAGRSDLTAEGIKEDEKQLNECGAEMYHPSEPLVRSRFHKAKKDCPSHN